MLPSCACSPYPKPQDELQHANALTLTKFYAAFRALDAATMANWEAHYRFGATGRLVPASLTNSGLERIADSTRTRMHLTFIKIVLAAFAAIVLVACGREQASSATSVAAEKDSPKEDSKKRSKADDAPRVADPMKEGY